MRRMYSVDLTPDGERELLVEWDVETDIAEDPLGVNATCPHPSHRGRGCFVTAIYYEAWTFFCRPWPFDHPGASDSGPHPLPPSMLSVAGTGVERRWNVIAQGALTPVRAVPVNASIRPRRTLPA